MAVKYEDDERLKKARKHYDDAKKAHDEFVFEVEKRYKTYRGILEQASDAARWTSKAHPPYVMHIVETSLASLIESNLKYRIRPRPSIAALIDPVAAEAAKKGADLHQILYNFQIKQDRFNDIQRPFILQNAIAGFSVAKSYWTKREERRRRLETVEKELLDEFDQPILGLDGRPITMPQMVEKDGFITVYDGPTTEVRDVRDWMWQPNATSLQTSAYIIDRVWKHPEEVYRGFEEGGPFGPSRGGWPIDDVRECLSVSKDSAREELVTREQQLFNIERTKGLVEVWEVWDNLERRLPGFRTARRFSLTATAFPSSTTPIRSSSVRRSPISSASLACRR